MADFLLIHGGSHGAWCWEEVIRELNRLGHRGHALDLPGAGKDSTPRAYVTFDSYVAAANDFIEKKDLRDFVLVGHSLAGIILPPIAAINRQRIREVVFVAAFVLDKGEQALDMIAPERIPEYLRLAEASDERSLALTYSTARERFFSDLDEEAARAAYAKLSPQPLAPYREAVRYGAPSFGGISRYIICREDRNLSLDLCERFADKLGGTIQEIEAGHDAMLSKPAKLASLLAAGF